MKRRRRSSERGGLTASRAARMAGWAAALLFVGWWAVKCGVVEALARDNPFAAAAVAPGDPRTRIELAMVEFAMRGGRVNPAAARDAYGALDRAPLAEEPFLLAAVSALARGDNRRGEALLEEARRRNGRERMVRLLLLDQYLRTGRTREAGIEIAVLDRLTTGVSDVLIPELARQAQDPARAKALQPVFRANPDLAQAVLARLAASGAETAVILDIAAGLGAQHGPAPAWQSALLERLAQAGKVGEAKLLWARFTGSAVAGAGAAVYDPSFAGRPGPAPFNWALVSGKIGTAERVPGGLQVEYYGRDSGPLARQLILAGAGPKRLRVRVEGDAKGDGSQLVWTVTCQGAAAPLASLPLRDVASAPKTLETGFVVPPGCPAQWLELAGKPGDVAVQQSARIAAVQVEAGAAR